MTEVPIQAAHLHGWPSGQWYARSPLRPRIGLPPQSPIPEAYLDATLSPHYSVTTPVFLGHHQASVPAARLFQVFHSPTGWYLLRKFIASCLEPATPVTASTGLISRSRKQCKHDGQRRPKVVPGETRGRGWKVMAGHCHRCLRCLRRCVVWVSRVLNMIYPEQEF